MYEALHVKTPADAAAFIEEVRRYYEVQGLPAPPFPSDAHLLAPCSILVTETHDAGGVKTGKIVITDPDCGRLFVKEWLISAGTY
jgi:hypothetical protein